MLSPELGIHVQGGDPQTLFLTVEDLFDGQGVSPNHLAVVHGDVGVGDGPGLGQHQPHVLLDPGHTGWPVALQAIQHGRNEFRSLSDGIDLHHKSPPFGNVTGFHFLTGCVSISFYL